MATLNGSAILEDVEAALGTGLIAPGDGEGWITLVERALPDKAHTSLQRAHRCLSRAHPALWN